ncbi:MAG TPA: TrmH family RNA methyltransferase [Flavobacteriales bacterium]|jgi:tRNA (guanosine-2'-O-)-methyltransferase|nr:TrmH family RNA methyltransferase [Flavobacteriales bacterium]
MKDYISYLENFVTDNRKKVLKEVLKNRTRHFTVALEDLYQMHNVSAVVRSADIFGIQDLHIIQKKYDPKLSHAIAKGAEKWLDIQRYHSTEDTIKSLKQKGYQIVATTPHTDDVNLKDFDISKPSAFFFGVEKDGLSDKVMSQADVFLKIPMYGFTESFNISVAAALIMYDVTERLRQSDINWQLTEAEQAQIYGQWLEKSIKSIDLIKKQYFQKINQSSNK